MFLITGASGFIGKGLQETLKQRGLPYRAVSRRTLPGYVPIGDVGTDTDWSEALRGVDTIVHLAAANQNVTEGKTADSAYRAVNVDGTARLAKQAAAAGVRRFIFLSSIKANGEMTEPGRPFTPASIPSPDSAYGRSKLEAEQRLAEIGKRTGLVTISIRPPLVYGQGGRGSFEALVGLVRKRLPLPLGSVENRRSMIYLENLTDIIVAAALHPTVTSTVLLPSDGDAVSTPQLLRMVASAAGTSAILLPFPVTLLETAARMLGKAELVQRLTQSLEVDSSQTCGSLGWTPPFTMREGLDRVLSPRLREKE
ncbi:nucleoside-diphosphate sugar epimerase [Rhizobium sp. Root708]|uniref:NAD-dependent epimerase/dehydratase family protein n=1 Tax=Rhizobium sp. Root708 TaxID=1736592 RepID=UPI0006FD5128|nr:NAD-dependent epimerase/dehydratase family protein [Rhizobium sp. Root708]KRB59430.1 nucleoside-diphosphate sugar epimerase [Rhizobium sp. Root708]